MTQEGFPNGSSAVRIAEDYLATANEQRLIREQNFLPMVYGRPYAEQIIGKLIDRGEFTPHDLFVSAAAIVTTFVEDFDYHVDLRDGYEILKPDPDIQYEGSTYLPPRSPRQIFGFRDETAIHHTRVLGSEHEQRQEAVEIARRKRVGNLTEEETFYLYRDENGNIRSRRSVLTRLPGEEVSADSLDLQEYDIPKGEIVEFLLGFQIYLQKAPVGYPYLR